MTEIVKRNRPDMGGLRAPLTAELFDPHAARRLVGRFLRRKYQVVLILLIVVIPAAIATYLAPRLYRSAAMVQVKADPVQVMPAYRDVADPVSGGANSYDTYAGTQEQLLRGQDLRGRVIRRLRTEFEGQPAAAEMAFLFDNFVVRRIERSELFELSYLGSSPEAAATLVNLFAEEYVKQNFEMRQGTRVKAEEELKSELEGLEKRLQLSEQELTAYAQQNQIMSLEQGQVDPLQERLRFLNTEVTTAETQVAVNRTSLDTLRQANVAEFPQRLVSTQIATLEARVLQVEQDLTTLRNTFGENWPAVVEKRAEATLVREQLSRERETVLARTLEQARLDLETAEARRRLAQTALDEQQGLVNQFHNASIQYNILKREVDTNRNLYDGLLERLRQTGVMAGFEFGNVQVVEPGRPNRNPASPRVVWNLGLAALLGLALGICFVGVAEFWDNTISSVEEVEQIGPNLGRIPLLAPVRSRTKTMPMLLSAKSNGNGHGADGNGKVDALVPRNDRTATSVLAQTLPFELTESVRAICASLLLSQSDERPRVIAITSPSASEGKTTLVAHLGRAFAEAGMSTLVVEADLRKPDLSKVFEVGNEDGLSLYLAGHVSPWPRIHETAIPNLFIAAGGPIPPNPAALLHSDRLTQFLEAAAADYEVVLVDTPPMSLADGRIIGAKADGVVLVVRAGQTARELAVRAWTLLEASGASGLGLVLNGEEQDPTDPSYYGYYGYTQTQA